MSTASTRARYGRHLAGATFASFVLSSIWYVSLDSTRTELLADRGTPISQPADWLMILEPVRTLIVAAVIGAAIGRLRLTSRAQAVRLAATAFVAFPAVLLLGSVIHGESSPGLAAIHAVDWLMKLMVAALVMRRFHFPNRTQRTVTGESPGRAVPDSDSRSIAHASS